ncbi:type IV pilin-like G/H family protein [Microcoleus sp. T2B6]|uniref:type IV pilin-like G/H family protein n=1 Tax=Microcoleus sp. T2B6 TaxID=3055424 RepID=UPI002FD65626
MSQANSKLASFPSKGFGCVMVLIFLAIILAAYVDTMYRLKKAKEQVTAAKMYVNAMNKVQQSHFLEKAAFTTSVKALEISSKTETAYHYSLYITKKTAFNYALSPKKELKSYVGGVFVLPAKEVDAKAAKDKMTTASILCEADSAGTIKPAEPTYKNGKIACGQGTTEVTR